MGLHPRTGRLGLESPEQLEMAKDVMQKAGCWQHAQKSILEISGGEFQRVILARALIQLMPLPNEPASPKLLLLDEAMSELDICAKFEMMDLIRSAISQTGLAVAGIQHDLHQAGLFADKVLALKGGKQAAFGSPKEVFTKGFFAEVFSVRAEEVSGKGFLFTGRA
jgi:iron complex transport system ATP-binding protein